ncbi:MAG: TlpA disulfide reductase family protein [Candidatus Alcyoniella australis]|nr:TlpA disulfide reductase family protein [Candidatus Alcyoniella australis]
MRKETKINLVLVGLFVLIAAGLYTIIFRLGGDSASGRGAGSVIAELNAQRRVSSNPKPIPGHLAPDFTVQTMEGGRFALFEQRGKVVLLNFFATWCAPCRMEVPQLDALNARFADANFVMLAISSESGLRRVLPQFSSQFRSPPLFAQDANNQITGSYRISGFPETYLIDKQGNIARRFIGPYDWNGPEFVALVQRLLDQ